MFYAYCFTDGVVRSGPKVPKGAIMIAFDTDDNRLNNRLIGACRHAKPRTEPPVLLIPGVPEADDERAKGDALLTFKKWIGFADIPKLTVFQRAELLHAYDPSLYLRPPGKGVGGAIRRGIDRMQKTGLFERGSKRLTSKALLAIARYYDGPRDIMADVFEKMSDERTVEKNKLAAKALADKERQQWQAARRLAEIAAMRRIFPELSAVTDDEIYDRLHAVLSI